MLLFSASVVTVCLDVYLYASWSSKSCSDTSLFILERVSEIAEQFGCSEECYGNIHQTTHVGERYRLLSPAWMAWKGLLFFWFWCYCFAIIVVIVFIGIFIFIFHQLCCLWLIVSWLYSYLSIILYLLITPLRHIFIIIIIFYLHHHSPSSSSSSSTFIITLQLHHYPPH